MDKEDKVKSSGSEQRRIIYKQFYAGLLTAIDLNDERLVTAYSHALALLKNTFSFSIAEVATMEAECALQHAKVSEELRLIGTYESHKKVFH